ncbi:MAG: hypothetical protein NXI10_02285 [bacterium]|nr:hypothetical protein [bacterium]
MKQTFLLLTLGLWSFIGYSQNPSDACGAGAQSLTSSATCTPSAYTLPGSYTNGGATLASCQAGQDRDDGWYQFVATGTSTTIEVSGDYDRTIAAFTGSCGTGELACDNQPSGTTATITFATTIGVTYYIQIHRNSGNNTATMAGTVCVHTGGAPPPPPTGTIIPTACATATYNLTSLQTQNFHDDGGAGGDPCADVTGTGNYANANCFTTTTICAAAGEYLIVDFSEFAMWNTTSGWDWMRIYDGPNTASPVLYDNSSTGPDNPFGDCGIGAAAMDFCASGQCMTFEFWATSVVNRAGWDATVSSVTAPCTPLPVELYSFDGEHTKNHSNRLYWSSRSEHNNDYYTIESSVDGEYWEVLAIVPGAGTTNLPSDYEYFDERYANGINYYRLTQTDFDGTSKSFDMITINNGPDGASGTYRIVNLMGQVVDEYYTGARFIIYEDGRSVKVPAGAQNPTVE